MWFWNVGKNDHPTQKTDINVQKTQKKQIHLNTK